MISAWPLCMAAARCALHVLSAWPLHGLCMLLSARILYRGVRWVSQISNKFLYNTCIWPGGATLMHWCCPTRLTTPCQPSAAMANHPYNSQVNITCTCNTGHTASPQPRNDTQSMLYSVLCRPAVTKHQCHFCKIFPDSSKSSFLQCC